MKLSKLTLTIGLLLLITTACSNLDVQTLNRRASELLKAGDIDGAISRLESINDLNASFPQTHYNLGIAYHKKQKYEKAINELNTSIKLKSDFADAYYTLGVIYEEMAYQQVEAKEESQKITAVKYFQLSKDNFQKYLDTAQTPQDAVAISSKVQELDSEIKNNSKNIGG